MTIRSTIAPDRRTRSSLRSTISRLDPARNPKSPPKRSTPAQLALIGPRQLILWYDQLPREVATGMWRKLPVGVPLDDHIQNGYMGLIQAAETYDCRMGVPFSAFARRVVARRIIDSVRRRHYVAETMERLEPWQCGSYEPEPEREQQERTRRQMIEVAIANLEPDERVCVRSMLAGETLDQLGRKFGVGESAACLRRKAALWSMRQVLEGMGAGREALL